MNRPLRHPNHRRPVTRREFLAQGFISGAAMIVAPSLFGLFKSREAYAQAAAQCNLSAGAGRIPFVCFDLAGGANIAGSNVLVGGPGGQLDLLSPAGYEKLGLPSDMQQLRKLFDLFETKTALLDLLEQSERAQGVKIFIGGESTRVPLDEWSMVVAPYEVDGQVVGTVGVIGPTRMAYERVIPIVDVTAKLMSTALSQH